MATNLVDLAKEIASKFHEGQYRKDHNGEKLPYIVHPKAVAKLIFDYGIRDDKAIAIAWLHDVLEDTPVTYDELKEKFGEYVAVGVYLLTRNVDNSEYKKRLALAPFDVKMIKLCDTLDNVETIECLSPKGIEKKVNDCQDFYIPLARELCSTLAEKIQFYIDSYLQKSRTN
jgi:GTP pyrophosphokinase